MKKVKTQEEDVETLSNKNDVNSVYINPLTDFGFKKLFSNKELLIPFLNDVVEMDIKYLSIYKYFNLFFYFG